MTLLQASLIYKPSLCHFYSSKRLQISLSGHRSCIALSCSLPFSPLDSTSRKSRICRHRLVFTCALHPDNVSSSSESAFSNHNLNSDLEGPPVHEFNNEYSAENGVVESEASIYEDKEFGRAESKIERDTKSDNSLEKGDAKSRLPLVVFCMGLLATARQGLEKFLLSDWFNWWPFWRQEKRLERLIEEADANPKDAAKQSALLAELNRHRLGSSLLSS